MSTATTSWSTSARLSSSPDARSCLGYGRQGASSPRSSCHWRSAWSISRRTNSWRSRPSPCACARSSSTTTSAKKPAGIKLSLEGLLKACEKEENVFVYKSLEKLSRKAWPIFFIKTWLFLFLFNFAAIQTNRGSVTKDKIITF